MINESYINALLANAAYINFGDTRGEIGADFSNNFISGGGFSQKQFEYFADRFRIVDHVDNSITGFSATIFSDSESNDQLTVAFRGSDPANPGDIVQDFLLAAGLSLYAGDFHLGQTGEIDSLLIANGLASEIGVPSGSHNVNFTGHSLGGHLSLVAAYKYPALVDQVFSFNGAGLQTLDILWANVIQPFIFGKSLESNRVNNYFGEAGPEVTASDILLFRPGLRQGITIENHGPIDNHAMNLLVDSLGLYQAFSLIDPTFDTTERISLIGEIIEGIGSSDTGFVQSGIHAIAELFQVPSAPSDIQAIINHLALDGNTFEIQPLTGLSAHAIYSVAAEDDTGRGNGFRYALANLLPFAVTSNITNTSASNPQYDIDSMSDPFLSDRSYMLSSMLYRNNNNLDFGPLSEPTRFSDAQAGVDFDGDHLGYPPLVGNEQPYQYYIDKRAHISFGSSADDAWGTAGEHISNNDDHLYGMGGNDEIDGLVGDDYIEGGDGNDILNGSAGSDLIYGNDNNDTITGGEGTDYLVGGAGSDTFHWNDGDGDDWIGDYDSGGDRIIINDNINLADLNLIPASDNSPWHHDSAHPEISVHYSGDELTVHIGVDAGIIHVSEYSENTGATFGITLGSYTPPPAQTTDFIVQATGTSQTGGETDPHAWWRSVRNQGGINWENTSITFIAPDVANYTGGTFHGVQGGAFFGGPLADLLVGDESSNALLGLSGDDRIDGGGGDDFLEGFAGTDYLEGGSGDDIIFGDANRGWPSRHEPPIDAIDIYIVAHLDDSPEHSNTLDGGADDDILSAGEYTDIATGGTGNDYLFGGSGEDTLSGGDNDDVLYGDSDFSYRYGYIPGPGPNEYTAYAIHEIAFEDGTGAIQQFDDQLSGGSGNDTLWGELGNDTILGGAGDDFLVGDRGLIAAYFDAELPAFEGTLPDLDSALHGDDELFGGEGSDTLYGLGGNDILSGGDGADALIGGEGDDVYIMQADGNQDFIIDSAGHHTLVFQGVQPESLFVVFQGEFAHVGIGSITSTDRFILPRDQWDNTSIAINSPDNVIDRARLYSAYANAEREVLIEIPGLRGISEAERDAVFSVDDSDPERPSIVLGTDATSAWITANYYDINDHRLQIDALPISSGLAAPTFTIDLKLLFGPDGWADFNWSGLGDVDRRLDGIPTDNLQGGFGHDHIIGTNGADQIAGNGGNDILEGLGGNDELFGGFGSNVLIGGPGADRLVGGLDALYEFYPGDGHDTLEAAISAKLSFNNVEVDSVALVYTGTQNSTFDIISSSNTVTAAGTTTIEMLDWIGVDGGSIPLVQRSSLEDGVFYSSRLSDTFDLGTGDDTVHVSAGSDDIYLIEVDGGNDTIVASGSLSRARMGTIRFSSDVDFLNLAFEFDALTGDARIFHGGNQIHLDGGLYTDWHNPLALFTLESESAPTLAPVIRAATGYSGPWLYGSYGTDNIISDDRAHVIRPGYGNDLIQAGGGNDHIFLADHYLSQESHHGIGNKTIIGGTGDDTIVAPLHQGLTFTYDLNDGIDTIEYDWSYTNREQAYAYDININPEESLFTYTPRGEDTLSFGTGITLQELNFTRLDTDLEITLNNSQGGILVKNFFLAYDADAPTGLSAADLETLFANEFLPDLLTNPRLLGFLPKTPIQWLEFGDDDPISLMDVLASSLNELSVLPGLTQLGTIGEDTIIGEPNSDNVIQSRQGNDTISLNGGTNIIDAGSGDDSITASGTTTLYAGTGDDSINLTGGDNVINLGEGNDYASLTGGNNVLEFGSNAGADFVGVFAASSSTIAIEIAEGFTVDDVIFRRLDFGGGSFVELFVPQTNAMMYLLMGETSVPQAGPLRTADEIRFSNGTILNEAEVISLASAPNGTSFTGTANADLIVGSQFSDSLDGSGGDDDIRGGVGHDILIGGTGNDLLHGDAGHDAFVVQGTTHGYDKVIGGDGFDTLRGSSSNDLFGLSSLSVADSLERIDGGDGFFDVVLGDSDANTLDFSATELVNILAVGGAGGDDVIIGSADDDIIFGGSGNDTITGGAGNDDLRGGDGNDLFIVDRQGNGYDQVTGGEGIDTLRGGAGNDLFGLSQWSAESSVERIDGAGGVFNLISGDASNNTLDFSATELINILGVLGGAGDDTLVGSLGNDFMSGNAGNDVLIGGAGSDILSGGVGNDSITGSAGNDTLSGGAGDDLFHFERTISGYDSVNGGEGFDTLLGSEDHDFIGLTQLTPSDGIERIDGGAGFFDIIGGDAQDNVLDFSNTEILNVLAIIGGEGADTINGSFGNDIINGDAGNDILNGAMGNDFLNGGQGDDTYRFNNDNGSDFVRNGDTNTTSVDTVEIAHIQHDELWFTRQGNDLVVDFVGTNDQINFDNWYAQESAQIDVFHAENRVLNRNQVDSLVNAMAGYAIPDGTGAIIPNDTYLALEPTLTTVWQPA